MQCVRSPWPDLLMISARGPDSESADEPGIDVGAPLLRVARQTSAAPPMSARFGGGEQPCYGRRVQFRSPGIAPFPRYGKATIPQLRDRAGCIGRYTPRNGSASL